MVMATYHGKFLVRDRRTNREFYHVYSAHVLDSVEWPEQEQVAKAKLYKLFRMDFPLPKFIMLKRETT
jgi:hypothetical protein